MNFLMTAQFNSKPLDPPLTEEEKASIDHLRRYAEANPLTVDMMIAIAEGRMQQVGNWGDRTITLRKTRLVFSLEDHPPKPPYTKPLRMRHLSISMLNNPMLDSGYLASWARELGFVESWVSYTWPERTPGRTTVTALNILQPAEDISKRKAEDDGKGNMGIQHGGAGRPEGADAGHQGP